MEAELELDLPGLDPSGLKVGDRITAHVRAADGREIPADVSVVGPGAIWSTPFSIKLGRLLLADLPREFMGFHSNAATWTRDGASLAVRTVMGSEPRGDFDFAGAKRAIGAHLADESLTALHIEACRPAPVPRVASSTPFPDTAFAATASPRVARAARRSSRAESSKPAARSSRTTPGASRPERTAASGSRAVRTAW